MRKNWLSFRIKLRIILWLILAGVVGWLLYRGVVPGGKIEYVYNFSRPDYFIGKLTPAERVEAIQDGTQKIIGDPVYFSLRTPRRFDQAKLTLKYRNEAETNFPVGNLVSTGLIEAGVLVDKIIWRYDLKPIKNQMIDKLGLAWDKMEENGVMLLQREKKYNSIGEFLNNLPGRNEIALYNYQFAPGEAEFLLTDYAAGEEEKCLGHSLRGAYQFYTYIDNEELNFKFSFFDLNQNGDSDPIDLNLYYAGQLLDSRHLADDESPARQLDFQAGNLPAGVYKIELRANDDIVTDEICTAQTKLALINKIWLWENGGQEIDLVTDSRQLQAQTTNPASLQTLKIRTLSSSRDYDQTLDVGATYKQFSLDLAGNDNMIILAAGDVILAGDGVFSFSLDSLMNPDFKKVTPNLDINQAGINYILAGYREPRSAGEWKIATAEFDLTNAYREDVRSGLFDSGQYGFIISVPGLSAEDGVDDWLEVDEIKIELEGKSLGEKLKGIRD